MGRRNLVVVRAGDSSLHPGWLAGPGERNFDLVVSYFGDDPAKFKAPDVARVDQKGGKWDGLFAFFLSRPDVFADYDYVWLPDDDIATGTATINGVFDAMSKYKLALAQPALTLDSYYSFFTLLQCPAFSIRYSDMIEVMAPCLSTALLKKVMPLLDGASTGFGLDVIWTRLNDDNEQKSAILDFLPVRHTRPVGGLLDAALRAMGKDPLAERERLRPIYQGIQFPPLIYAAIDKNGRMRRSRLGIGLTMAWAYLNAWRCIVHPPHRKWETLKRVVRRQIFKPFNIAKLNTADPR